MKYCSQCGHTLAYRIPENDTLHRHVCEDKECGYIHYQNPKIVVGTIPISVDGRVLLCKRAIMPRSGFWTLPAGFLENGETMLEGGLRETLEEACAEIKQAQMYRIYDLPYINQVYVFFHTELNDAKYAVGPESEEVRLFAYEEIPWSQIAFPVVTQTLQDYYKEVGAHDSGNKANGTETPLAIRYRALESPFPRGRP